MRHPTWCLMVCVAAGIALLGGTGSPRSTEAVGPGTWSLGATMSTPRYDHQATLLPTGRVLVTGGYAGSTWTGVAEIYSPVSNSWSPAGSHMPRTLHAAVLLRDGRVLISGGFGGFGGPGGSTLSSAEIYDPATNSWSATGSMNSAREQHTLTLLVDGRVLAVGGGTAETYDPLTGMWTPTGAVAVLRNGHRSLLLATGEVLVAGGLGTGGVYLNSSELFDPVSNTWTPTDAMSGARLEHTLTLLPDGRALVGGGHSGVATDSVETYDPGTDVWSDAAPLPEALESHEAAALGDGTVLYAGGSDTGGYSEDAYVYDPDADAWTSKGDMTVARTHHTLTVLPDGRALAVGVDPGGVPPTTELYDPSSWSLTATMVDPRSGAMTTLFDYRPFNVAGSVSPADADAYNAASDTWTPLAPMFADRTAHRAVTLDNGRVLVTGGLESQPAQAKNSQVYNPATNSWTDVAPNAITRVNGTLTRLPGNRALAAGGDDNDGSGVPYFDTAEIYDFATNSWIPASGMMSVRRQFQQAVPLNDGRVLMIGGQISPSTGAYSSTPLVDAYSPATDSWTPLAPLITTRYLHTATKLDNGKVLVVGGVLLTTTTGTLLASAELYDPASNTWSPAGSLATPRSEHSAVLLANGKVLVVGGEDGGPPLYSAELYDPATNSWTSAGSAISGPRTPTSALLSDGRVLVTFNANGHPDKTAQIYDPGTSTDTDGDGYNDGLELALSQHPWSPCATMRADVTGDGVVNSGDLLRVALKFGVRPPPSRLDQNADTVLNAGDLLKVSLQNLKSVLSCP
jgi:N-acetylneuraminic acid mutarotase